MEQSPQDHDLIRRLLAIKRHELPPAGFFDQFHAGVMGRIEANIESAELAWWERALLWFDSKPIMAGAYAIAVAGLFVCGLEFSQMIQTETAELTVDGIAIGSASTTGPASFSSGRFESSIPPVYAGPIVSASADPGSGKIIPDSSPVGPPAFLFSPSELNTRTASDGLGAR